MPQSAGELGYSPNIQVPTAPSGGSPLPHTGMDLAGPAGLGAVLFVAAVIILAATRNGRRLALPTPDRAPSYLRDKTGRDPDDPRYEMMD